MACNCENQGNTYHLNMGCCVPIVANANSYYTKSEIDEKLDDILISGCCITPEEVDEKIDAAISGIDLSNYATEQWVEDKHYITGVDLSNYALKSEIPTVPTKVSAFENDVPYLTQHQSLSGYVTDVELSAYTYDKATIDEKVAGGGTFDPTQYYNKSETNNLLDNKLDASAYTPTDLTNYYDKTEVNNIVNSAKTEIEGEIPSLSGYATQQWVENKHYITGVDLSNYALKSEIPTVPTSNSAFTNDMHYLTSADTATYVTSGNVETQIVNHFWCGSEQQWSQISGNTQPNTLYLVY